MRNEITYTFSSFNGATAEFGNRLVISSHTLLYMWSFIHAVIKVNPCYEIGVCKWSSCLMIGVYIFHVTKGERSEFPVTIYIRVRSWRCDCLVTWFCYQMIAKLGKKTGPFSWSDPFTHSPLQWRHNGRDDVSNHQLHHCLLIRLFSRRSKKTSKLHVTGDRWIPSTKGQ